MDVSPTENSVRFGLFALDLRTRQLTKNGARVRLPQQPIQILSMLLERPGEVVTREELRRRLWSSDVFVDFDHGLNKSIQKLRDALGDSANSPRYIETIPRIGYRFIAPANEAKGNLELSSDTNIPQPGNVLVSPPEKRIAASRQMRWPLLAACGVGVAACVALALGGLAIYRARHRPLRVTYTQLTDFTDSAVAPALSPDGRMVAFIRGGNPFLSSDRIYVKMLPNGEARPVSDDDRPKYGLAFSPDGSEIAYTVLEPPGFSTYKVSVLGGESHLLLKNAAGLVWLNPQRLLFSEIRSEIGIHLGVVTATVTRGDLREIYFPAHERGMAHYSFPSPDRRWAVVVEMNGDGDWGPCLLIGLEGQGPPGRVGPAGACTSAGWSPDGSRMYFTATVEGQSHIWQQRFQKGKPRQITFGPTEEDGVAMEPGARALITSLGVHQSAIWIHDASGERPLSSEGEVVDDLSPVVFNPDASIVYYLLRHGESSDAGLWRTVVATGKSEAVFPGVSMIAFDLSRNGERVVYATADPSGTTQLWLAPVDRSMPARKVGISGARSPHFGADGEILFQQTEGNKNYLEQMKLDGSQHSRVFPYPIVDFHAVSPNGRYVMVVIPKTPKSNHPQLVGIPVDGGAPQSICEGYCSAKWSTDGKFLFVDVQDPSSTSPGRTLAISLGPGESLPDLPAGGIPPLAQSSMVRGAQSIPRGDLIPGKSPRQYAWVNTSVHRNLYRISLP